MLNQPRKFALVSKNHSIVPNSAVIELDTRKPLPSPIIIIEKSPQQHSAKIITVRNWRQTKAQSIFYVDFDQNLTPLTEYLFDLRTNTEADKNTISGSYLKFPAPTIYIEEQPDRLRVLNLTTEAYIFIYNLDTRTMRIHYVNRRGLGQDVIDANVVFIDSDSKDVTVVPVLNSKLLDISQFVSLDSRHEFGNHKESYATTSTDIKHLIINRATAAEARTLCQLDRRHRQLCQNRLTPRDKARICLDTLGSATECDLIPIFSQQQFLQLIPKNILIYPEDAYYNTYEFYSQSYKMPTEGFAQAIRKAKIMNTICAMVRPEFLLAQSTVQLPIPPYLDAQLLDTVKGAFLAASRWKYLEERFLDIAIGFLNKTLVRPIIISIKYQTIDQYILDEAVLILDNVSKADKFSIAETAAQDKFLEPIIDYMGQDMDNDSTEIPDTWSLVLPDQNNLNVFQLSRLIKVLFDEGYDAKVDFVIWTASPKPIEGDI